MCRASQRALRLDWLSSKSRAAEPGPATSSAPYSVTRPRLGCRRHADHGLGCFRSQPELEQASGLAVRRAGPARGRGPRSGFEMPAARRLRILYHGLPAKSRFWWLCSSGPQLSSRPASGHAMIGRRRRRLAHGRPSAPPARQTMVARPYYGGEGRLAIKTIGTFAVRAVIAGGAVGSSPSGARRSRHAYLSRRRAICGSSGRLRHPGKRGCRLGCRCQQPGRGRTIRMPGCAGTARTFPARLQHITAIDSDETWNPKR